MGKNTYLVVVAYLIVGSTDLSRGYGTKGGSHSFSQSYSSSSASAQSSSYSSSGSYSFGDKGSLPIIGPIPIASSASVASSSAGAASAVSGTSSSIASGAAVASASAGAASAVSGSSSNAGGDHQKGSYIFGVKGSTTGGGASGISATSVVAGSSPNAAEQHKRNSVVGASVIGGGSGIYGGTYGSQTAGTIAVSPGKEGHADDNAALRVPCCKPIPPGPNGSIYDYKVPSKVDTIGTTTSGVAGYGHSNVGSGSYGTSTSVSQVSSSGYGHQATVGSGTYGGVSHPNPSIEGTPSQKKPCCKGPFPGPNGSIYDSKPASAVGTAVKPSGVQEPTKPQLPLVRPPVNFPGPSGSIYTSKPVNTGAGTYSPGTYTKPVGSYQPSGPAAVPQVPTGGYQTPSLQTISSNSVGGHANTGATFIDTQSVPQKPVGQGQYEYQTNTNVVSSTDGSYQTQYESVSKKPIGQQGYQSNTNVGQQTQYQPAPKQPGGQIDGQYGYQSSSNVGLGNVNYQTQYQGSVGYKPSCNQGSCNKEPPRIYLQPPQDQGKPVVETVQEQPLPINIPNPGNTILIPQTQTTATPIKPGVSGIQVTDINTGYNTGKVPPVISYKPEVVIPGTSKPQGPQYHQNQPQQTGIQQGYQGSYSASSTTAGSSTSSTGYSVGGGVHGVVQKPTGSSVTIIDGNQKKEDGDRVLYVSGPGHSSSVTENNIIGSSLHEGPRGSPLVPVSYDKYDDKTTGYDGSNEDSAIVFFDGNQGSGGYSSGGGYASSGSVYSHTGAGGSNIIYSSSKGSGKKPTGTYVSTVLVDLNKPSGTSQGTGVSGSGSTQGVVSVGTIDNSKNGNSGSYGVSGSGQGVISDGSKTGNSGSYGYVSGSLGHKGAPCTSYGCPTSHGQYSNAVPTKNVAIHISAVPVGSYSSGGKTGGSYDGTLSSSEEGSAGGSYIISSASTGSGGVSGGYAGGSIIGHKGIPCSSNGCGTSYRQYSNGVPSGKVSVHVSSVPSGSGGTYSSGGSYGGSYGSSGVSKGGSAGGGYSASSASVGNAGSDGGFLSSIFLGDGTVGHGGSHGKGGSYAHSSSFSKASSYASSSSFSSASSGSYGSSHY